MPKSNVLANMYDSSLHPHFLSFTLKTGPNHMRSLSTATPVRKLSYDLRPWPPTFLSSNMDWCQWRSVYHHSTLWTPHPIKLLVHFGGIWRTHITLLGSYAKFSDNHWLGELVAAGTSETETQEWMRKIRSRWFSAFHCGFLENSWEFSSIQGWGGGGWCHHNFK